MGEVSPHQQLCRCLLSSCLRACLASALSTKPGPDRQPQTSILIQILLFYFYCFQMFKAVNVWQSYSYAVTCTWLREESSSLYPHSGDTVPTPRQQAGTAPSLHMQMLAHPPRQHSVFFASVDTLLTKSKTSDFALPNPLWDRSFLEPNEKQIQIISGNVGVGRYRRVILQCGPLPRRHPHSLPQHESLTCTLDCPVSHLLPCAREPLRLAGLLPGGMLRQPKPKACSEPRVDWFDSSRILPGLSLRTIGCPLRQ